MSRNKAKQFSASGSEIPSILFKNSKGVREGKRKEVKRNNQEHETVVRMQREKIQSGRKKIRGFKARVGCECCISRSGPD